MLFSLVQSPNGAEYAVRGHPAGQYQQHEPVGWWGSIGNKIVWNLLLHRQYTVSVWTAPSEGLPRRKWKERVDYRGTAEDRVEQLVGLIASGTWTPGTTPPK